MWCRVKSWLAPFCSRLGGLNCLTSWGGSQAVGPGLVGLPMIQTLKDSVEVCRSVWHWQVLCVALGSTSLLSSGVFTSEKLLGYGLFMFKCQLFILWPLHCVSQSLQCWATFGFWEHRFPYRQTISFLLEGHSCVSTVFLFYCPPSPQGPWREWGFGNMSFSFLALP